MHEHHGMGGAAELNDPEGSISGTVSWLRSRRHWLRARLHNCEARARAPEQCVEQPTANAWPAPVFSPQIQDPDSAGWPLSLTSRPIIDALITSGGAGRRYATGDAIGRVRAPRSSDR